MVSSPQQCILAIGTTGSGKSFTGTVFGAPAIVGHSTTSQTDKVTVYDCRNGRFYVDTPGFDDSHESKGDAETARLILRTMVDAKITNVTTILWFVVSENRATASLHRQARFIESLAQYYDGNVWDNIIIVHKGTNIEQGPCDAAKEIARDIYQKKHNQPPDTADDLLKKASNFAILLFESLSPTDLRREANFTSDQLNSGCLFKSSEPERILAVYESLMKVHLEHPIPLSFKKFKCLKCPEESDPRLAVAKCHLDGELVHSKKAKMIHRSDVIQKHSKGTYWCHTNAKENYHPKPETYYHPSSAQEKIHKNPQAIWFHPGEVGGGNQYSLRDHTPGANALRIFTFGIVDNHETKSSISYYRCCSREIDSTGCTPKCCDENPGCMSVFACCQTDNQGCKKGYECCYGTVGSTGCQERYKCCQDLQPCTKLYKCCDSTAGSDGCENFYKCCNKPVNEKPQGCHPVCEDCNLDLNSDGCKKVCKNCKSIQFESEGCFNGFHDFGLDVPQTYSWALKVV